MNNIDNIQFKFTQKTNENIAKGKCILAFPSKLKCDYKDKNEKELIVNKKMMAITQKRYGKTLFYPLSKSTFINILNKNEENDIDQKSLKLKEIYVDGGPVMKRFRAASMGRASRLRRPTSHLTVIINTKQERK